MSIKCDTFCNRANSYDMVGTQEKHFNSIWEVRTSLMEKGMLEQNSRNTVGGRWTFQAEGTMT
jgi:hypothetical protein